MIWAVAPYTPSEVLNFLPRYLDGGVRLLPTFPFREVVRASFPGLNDSIRIQNDAAMRWEEILARPLDPDVRVAMETDVAWFQATRSRYRLMAATAEFTVAQFSGSAVAEIRERIRVEIEFLENSSTTDLASFMYCP